MIDRVFADHPDIGAAVQCAALIVVPDSVADPVGYYRANVAKGLEFVAHLLRNGCERMIFSSSAAIYRSGADLTVDETHPSTRRARTRGRYSIAEGIRHSLDWAAIRDGILSG